MNRKRNLRKKLLEFSDSEAVITDRLHGMVFAAIMNTPCMVLTNCNYKIKVSMNGLAIIHSFILLMRKKIFIMYWNY